MAGHHKILIIGGGAAGITVAANLKRRGVRAGDIAIVEPSDTHYYQPAFTLVGAGAYDLAKTRRPTDSLIPSGVARIKALPENSIQTATASNSRPATRSPMTIWWSAPD